MVIAGVMLGAGCSASQGTSTAGSRDGGEADVGIDVSAAGASSDAAMDALDAPTPDAAGNDADADGSALLPVHAKLVAVGYAIDHHGELIRWGFNADASAAQLPEGPFSDAAGQCALRPSGELVCWDTDIPAHSVPSGTFRQVVWDGGLFADYCALRSGGDVTCWGNNTGEGGPTAVPAGAFLQVSAGDGFACGIRTDGTLTCWGGTDKSVYSKYPPPYPCLAPQPPSGTFSLIASGSCNTCAIASDGTVACWNDVVGEAPAGQFTDVSTGWWNSDGPATCGVRIDGSISCWGDWGSQNLDKYLAPPPPGPFIEVVTNGSAACAMRADNSLVCWGDDTYGYVSHAPASL